MHFKSKQQTLPGWLLQRPPVVAKANAPVVRRIVYLALAVLAGCSAAHVRAPLTQTVGVTPGSQGEFWYQLAKTPIASNDDAFHALLLYIDSKDDSANYAARVKSLQSRQMLASNFTGSANDGVDRGTLAVALDRMLHIQGGLTMQVFGASPRYALRAAVGRGLFPDSSPNQGITGGEFVGVMQKAEEYEHGNPSEGSAHFLPADIHPDSSPATQPVTIDFPETASPTGYPALDLSFNPVYLDDIAPAPTSVPTEPSHLKAIITRIQGDLVEVRQSPTAPWMKARPRMILKEGTEIRTGPKSAVCFLIPAEEAFCLDSQGEMTLQQAVINLRKASTRVDLDRGRLREDLTHNAPLQIQEAGIEHDTVIKSPNSALALRGTKVSLFEQPSFEPVAVSLTGQAFFTNTNGLRVPFGGGSHVIIVGNQTSPADQADARTSAASSANAARLAFETRELSIVTQRGGFQRGDVIVGNLSINDFKTLPGALDFVLQWNGGSQMALNDLNLAVFSPLNTVSSSNPKGVKDFVANPPFTVSLTPSSPASIAERKAMYPQTSSSGGQISLNSVGPSGLELAFWGKSYPIGTYNVRVFNLVDAIHPPTTVTNAVPYTVDVYQNGTHIYTYSGSVGLLQTSPAIQFPVSAATGSTKTSFAKNTLVSGRLNSHRLR